jgi:hypothetical protein
MDDGSWADGWMGGRGGGLTRPEVGLGEGTWFRDGA